MLNRILKNAASRPERSLAFAIFTVTGIIYYVFVWHFAQNIPLWDDYDTAFGFMETYQNLDFPDNFLLLFSQHNEHRIFSYHVLVPLQHFFFGEVNFRYMIFAGNLVLPALAFVMFRFHSAFRDNPLLFVPVFLLLFVPRGIMGMSGMLMYLFCLGSLWMLTRNNIKAFVTALVMAALTTASFGNGFFIFPLGLGILLTEKERNRHYILTWSLFAVLITLLFFTNYHSVADLPAKSGAFSHPVQVMAFFITFFSAPYVPLIAPLEYLYIATGCLVLSVFLYGIWINRKQILQHRVIVSFLLFILLAAFSASISRYNFGTGGAIADRYIFISVLFSAFVYILIVNKIASFGKKTTILLLALSLILYLTRMEINEEKLTMHTADIKSSLVGFMIQPDSCKIGRASCRERV